jgi:hypothetical protein
MTVGLFATSPSLTSFHRDCGLSTTIPNANKVLELRFENENMNENIAIFFVRCEISLWRDKTSEKDCKTLLI